MDAAAAWAACEFQMANWAVEEPAAVQPGTSSLKAYMPGSSGGRQELVEHHTAATQHNPTEKEAQERNMEISHIYNNPDLAFEDIARDFEARINMKEAMIKEKIHRRCPETIPEDLRKSYMEPSIVSIGPFYHHNLDLKKAEQVKHVAVRNCIRESCCTAQELYEAVVPIADDVRSLYDKDVMAGFCIQDFRDMMFCDACFLVQFMAWSVDDSEEVVNPSLRSFFKSEAGIEYDILLLENQLPWRVVETVMRLRLRPLPLDNFVASWREILQDRRKVLPDSSFDLDHSYEPPHLLGLLRHHIMGNRNITKNKQPNIEKFKSISVSVSAIELAKMGIKLTANNTTDIINIGLNKKGIFSGELLLAPLSLDGWRAGLLVNMAALELCMTPSLNAEDDGDSAVCSFLLLLSKLVHREEDVQELRRKGILKGGAGLTNKEALDFFTSLQSLPTGTIYISIMLQIESYRVNRPIQTKGHAFLYKNKNTMYKAFGIFVAVVGIFGTLIGILVSLKNLKAHR